MTELQIQRCTICATAWFPERLRCPNCGGTSFETMPAGEGSIEEQTMLHRTGERLASIRLDAGPVVIARVNDGVSNGTRVRLHTKTDGAIWTS